MSAPESFYLIAYDIPNDKRRGKVHNLLSGYCRWRQYSLFEGYLTPQQRLVLMDKLSKIVNVAEDNLRFYPLCAADVAKIITIGSEPPAPETTIII